jgi:hypothetical protein
LTQDASRAQAAVWIGRIAGGRAGEGRGGLFKGRREVVHLAGQESFHAVCLRLKVFGVPLELFEVTWAGLDPTVVMLHVANAACLAPKDGMARNQRCRSLQTSIAARTFHVL